MHRIESDKMPIIKNNYFFSDLHFGYPNAEQTRAREKLLNQLLDRIADSTEALWFLGDIFDFWWEYKKVIPAGFSRFLGKIAEFTDAGVPVHFFSGNHDIWMKNYLTDEIGVHIHHKPLDTFIGGKRFYLAHGDALGPGDITYKLLKKVFTNTFLQWCFARLHPNFALFLAHTWSHGRRKKSPLPYFSSLDEELLVAHAKEVLQTESFDYFVFGHRHIAMHITLAQGVEFVNTGEWLSENSFAKFGQGQMELLQYKGNEIKKYPYPNPEKNPYLIQKNN